MREQDTQGWVSWLVSGVAPIAVGINGGVLRGKTTWLCVWLLRNHSHRAEGEMKGRWG